MPHSPLRAHQPLIKLNHALLRLTARVKLHGHRSMLCMCAITLL